MMFLTNPRHYNHRLPEVRKSSCADELDDAEPFRFEQLGQRSSAPELDVPAVPKRSVMGIPSPGDGEGEVLEIAVVRGRDDQVPTRLQDFGCEPGQGSWSVQMLYDFGGNNSVETADVRLVIDPKAVEGDVWISGLSDGSPVLTRLASLHNITGFGEFPAKSAISAAEIEDAPSTDVGETSQDDGREVGGRALRFCAFPPVGHIHAQKSTASRYPLNKCVSPFSQGEGV